MSLPAVSTLLAWLATYLVHSTLVLGVAWLVTRRARSPRLVERTWRAAVLGPLVTATVASLHPATPVLGVVALRTPAPAAELPAARPRAEGPADPADGAEPRVPATSPGAAAGSDERRPVAVPLEEPRRTTLALAPSRTASHDPRPTGGERGSDATGARTRRPGIAPADAGIAPIPRETAGSAPASAIVPARPALRGAAVRAPRTTSGPPTLATQPDTGAVASLAVPTSERPDPAALPARMQPSSAGPAPGGGNAARLGALVDTLPRLSWSELALVLWTTPALVLALALVVSVARLSWDLRRRRLVPDPDLQARFDALRRSAGVRRRVRLSSAPELTGPITFGLLRPEVTLPERALSGLRPAHERAMLAHELAHVRRRDPLWFALLAGLERVLFVQPLLRVARRRLVAVAEERADDLAVRWTGDRVALASCLAEIAGWIVDARRPRALPVAGMASSRLGHRIERLLVPDPAPEARQRWFVPAAALLLATTGAALPSVRAAGADAPTGTVGDASVRERGADAPRAAESMRAARQRSAAAERRTAIEAELASDLDAIVETAADDEDAMRTSLLHELTLLEDELALLGAELGELSDAVASTCGGEAARATLERLAERYAQLEAMHALARRLLSERATPNPFPDHSGVATPRAPEPPSETDR